MELTKKKCVPCEGGIGKLTPDQIAAFMPAISGWSLRDNQIQKKFTFAGFLEAMAFLNKVADIAEEEGHHPDFCVHYNKVDMTLWTHALDGLSENDFILAAKIDALI